VSRLFVVEPEEYEAALGLAWLSGYGCSPLLRHLSRYGARLLWNGSGAELRAWGLSPAGVCRFRERRAEFSQNAAEARLEECDAWFLPFGALAYPPELAQLRQPPPGLFVRGRRDSLMRLLSTPRVTIVGTRRATSYGYRATDLLASAFAERGVTVVSGMALGIDGRAHLAAVDGGTLTAAVLGCGVDVVYPARHRRLYRRVVDEGLVLSELPPGTRPARWTFPARNRLLAALGDAVLVVEGSKVSGALQTAGAALELGRPVFAVPGQITNDGHQGCNWLIYDGAAPAVDPCVTVEEFLHRTRIERLNREALAAPRVIPNDGGVAATTVSLQTSVLAALEGGERSVDAIADCTGLETRHVTAVLARLEIDGTVARCGGGRYIRAP
jgi:DNA processing protein